MGGYLFIANDIYIVIVIYLFFLDFFMQSYANTCLIML
jgi:hypothetical protein